MFLFKQNVARRFFGVRSFRSHNGSVYFSSSSAHWPWDFCGLFSLMCFSVWNLSHLSKTISVSLLDFALKPELLWTRQVPEQHNEIEITDSEKSFRAVNRKCICHTTSCNQIAWISVNLSGSEYRSRPFFSFLSLALACCKRRWLVLKVTMVR